MTMLLDQTHELRMQTSSSGIKYVVACILTEIVVARGITHLNQTFAEAHAREALRKFKASV